MVLAQGEHLDVLDNHKLIVILMEYCTVDQISYIFFVPLGEKHQSFGISLWRLEQAFPLRIFSNALKDSPHGARELLNPLLGLFRRRLQPLSCSQTSKMKAQLAFQS